MSIGDKYQVRVNRGMAKGNAGRLQRELDNLRKKWDPVLRLYENDLLTNPFSLSRLIPKVWPHLHKFHGTVASEINDLFSDQAVRSAMAGALWYTGTPPQKTPILLILGLIALLSKGYYLPEGGMGKISEALGRALRNNGGEIFLNAKIQKILLKNGRVSGLKIEGFGPIEVDAVISTVNGMATFRSLLDPEELPSGMSLKIRKAPLSPKAFSIQLGLKNVIGLRSHTHIIFPMMKEHFKFFSPGKDEGKWFITFVPTVTMPELSPKGGSIVEIFPAINQDLPADDWNERKTGEVVESTLQALTRQNTIDIAVKRVRSPKDFQGRLHLYKGAVYGLSPAAALKAQFPHASQISGLYQAGQTTYPGFGVAPAAMSGIFAAEALLAEENR